MITDEQFRMHNVLDISDVMKPMVAKFDKLAERANKFSVALDKHLKKTTLQKCPIHNCDLPIDRDRTFSESWWAKKIVIVYDKCPKCNPDKNADLTNERFRKMGIPEKVIHATFENYETGGDVLKEKALRKAKSQSEMGTGFLILRGKVGTGKSHLAAAILKVRSGVFVTLGDLIGELRHTYDDGGQESMVQRYRKARCLVIDELSTEVRGTDIPTFLYRICAWRYDRGLLTIITSNDTIEDIKEIMGPKLVDRMSENYQVATMEWESYRVK